MSRQLRVLVTGASGYLGARLVARARASGFQVVCVDQIARESCGQHLRADISKAGPWQNAFCGVHTVFHLAGKAHAVSEFRQDEAEYFRVNTDGTRFTLEAARRAGAQRFVLFSSVKAMSRSHAASQLGVTPDRPLDESDAVEPDTPYGRSKLAAEALVLAGGYVPEPVVLRLCDVYGPASKGNLQQMLAAVARRRFPPLPRVPNRRSMVHVDDVLAAATLAASHQAAVHNVFIVSDGRAYSTEEILAQMRRAIGHPPISRAAPLAIYRALGVVGDHLGRIRGRRFVFDTNTLTSLLDSSWFSSAKIERLLGFRPEWNLEQALRSMIAALPIRSAETE